MTSTPAALRFTLVAIAGALAAAAAHVAIDVAGDYLLAHDAYDGVAHHSRALVLAGLAVGALYVFARALLDAIDRRSGSRISLLSTVRAAVGRPLPFALQAIAVSIVLLAGMEWLDCIATGTPVDGIDDLFGGSIPLGVSTCAALGAACGLLVHRLVRALAAAEPFLARIVTAITRLPLAPAPHYGLVPATALPPRNGGVTLARRGRKRGPPLATPA